jgi:hypothetical protein
MSLLCVCREGRGLRSASDHRTSGLIHVHNMTVQLGQASYSSSTGNTEGRQSKRQERLSYSEGWEVALEPNRRQKKNVGRLH